MITEFSLREPAAISRCGLIEAWTRLAVAFDETMEPISEIGGVDQIHVSVWRNDSSGLYIDGFAYPLYLYCKIMSSMGKTVEEGMVYAHLYFNRETNEASAKLLATGKEFRGDVDTVVKSLSAAILSWLQDQCSQSDTTQ